MKSFEFVVETVPKGKARPRFTRIGSQVRTYTPKATQDYEWTITQEYINQGGDRFDYPYLEVDITAYFPIPKSTRKADRLLMESEKVPYNHKPDTDNIAKCVLDALNDVAYEDDKQIVILRISKYYGKVPRIKIKIREVENG